MKVQCDNCQHVVNLPDGKLTPGMEVAFRCPNCKDKNVVKVPEDFQADAKSRETAPDDSLQDPIEPSTAFDSGDDDDGPLGEFFEEGSKPCLVCFDMGPTRTAVVKAMEELDYVTVIPTSVRDALKRIKLTKYAAIVIQEDYDGQSPKNNVILAMIQPMEMTFRRRLFVALFGKSFQTMDQMAAYAMSVNAVINIGEEENFDKILKRAVAEYERFYKIFLEVMDEIGKI